jgi:hypothetical protein
MNARATQATESPTPLRSQRRAAGLVAQYVHELSDRHARSRRRSPVPDGPRIRPPR